MLDLLLLWPISLAISLVTPHPVQTPAAACTDPAKVVQAEVEAYNRHDLNAFVALFSPNVRVAALPADTALVSDTAGLRRAYAFMPTAPAGYGVDIPERIVSGCFVIDHERLRALNGKPASEAGVAIYQVEGSLIRRMWFPVLDRR